MATPGAWRMSPVRRPWRACPTERAYRRQVEGRDRPHSEPGLEETGERRKGELGRGGGDDDRVEVAGRGTGGFERGAGGGLGEVEERFGMAEHAPLFDAAPLPDPAFAEAEPPLDLGARHPRLRHRRAAADQARAQRRSGHRADANVGEGGLQPSGARLLERHEPAVDCPQPRERHAGREERRRMSDTAEGDGERDHAGAEHAQAGRAREPARH